MTAFIIFQPSNAQLQEGVFNTSRPLIDNISNNLQQSLIQSSPPPILIASNYDGTHFVWESVEDGKSEIIYAKRAINGFDYKINLSNSSAVDSINPNMLIDNRNIFFTWWEKYDNGTQIPMIRATSDAGITFGGIGILSKLPFR